MKVIDGKNAVLGRMASYVAKEALKGEEIVIVNCGQVIITGGEVNLKKEFEEKRSRFGASQKGPKHSKTSEKIVKRVIRGMLPDHRQGRGRIAWKKIKCFVNIPKEFQEIKKIKMENKKRNKFSRVKEFTK